MACPFVSSTIECRHGKLLEFVRCKNGKPGLYPFAESLVNIKGERVVYAYELGQVVSRVVGKIKVIEIIGAISIHVVVGYEASIICLEFQRMY